MILTIEMTYDQFRQFKKKCGKYLHWFGLKLTLQKGDPYLSEQIEKEKSIIIYYDLDDRSLQWDRDVLGGYTPITYEEFINDYGCPVL